ncbi:MAG: prolipoprotein diacylglyceryl transferase [Proteobacteria bacterium]|nr:prolipoprotein diacylglyceryl transferase [Pseudomonadota bacterium]
MEEAFVHDINPLLLRIGSFNLTYHRLSGIAVIVFGFILWWWQMRRGGYSDKLAWIALPWVVFVLFISIRITHCVFYDPKYYFYEPWRILQVWRGGFASHGALLGTVIAFYIYGRWFKLPSLDFMDRFCFSSSAGAALVRMGNFLGSEIVGRETSLPWGVRFMEYDNGQVVRHPVQLYEFVLAILVFIALIIADRLAGKEKRPRGLIFGLSMTLYFGVRFFIEFVKEYQVLSPSSSTLTMGHYLSIIPIIAGVALLFRARRLSKQPDAEAK